MNINYNDILKKLFPYMLAFALAFLATTLIFFLLPKSGVDYVKRPKKAFYSYSLNAFGSKSVKSSKPKLAPSNYALLSNLVLKAVYATSSGGGWVVVQEKNKNKSHILKRDESFKGYTLKVLFQNFVLFEKNGREYKLELPNSKSKFTVKSNKKFNEKVTYNKGKVQVNREIVNEYVNDLGKFWQSIQLNEIKNNGKLQGFRVSRIDKNSALNKMGLKEGDVLKRINGVGLDNYNELFKIYKRINELDNLKIEVLRNNANVELQYEIN